jgi:hypothetical protein
MRGTVSDERCRRLAYLYAINNFPSRIQKVHFPSTVNNSDPHFGSNLKIPWLLGSRGSISRPLTPRRITQIEKCLSEI